MKKEEKLSKVSLAIAIIGILMFLISLLMAGCSRSIYAHGKPFKPDKHNRINRCATYDDVMYRR